MPVSDEMFILGIALLFIYLVIYKKSKILGNLSYMGLGIIIMAYMTTTLGKTLGWILLGGALLSLIIDLMKPKK